MQKLRFSKSNYMLDLFLTKLSCRQTSVPRTSRGRSPLTSPGCSLKILFENSEDVPIWRPEEVPIWRPEEVLKLSPGNVLIWHSRDIPGRLIRDVPRKFSGRTFRVLKFGCPKISFNFPFRTYLVDQIYLKAFQYSTCIENPVILLRWSIFCKIS